MVHVRYFKIRWGFIFIGAIFVLWIGSNVWKKSQKKLLCFPFFSIFWTAFVALTPKNCSVACRFWSENGHQLTPQFTQLFLFLRPWAAKRRILTVWIWTLIVRIMDMWKRRHLYYVMMYSNDKKLWLQCNAKSRPVWLAGWTVNTTFVPSFVKFGTNLLRRIDPIVTLVHESMQID